MFFQSGSIKIEILDMIFMSRSWILNIQAETAQYLIHAQGSWRGWACPMVQPIADIKFATRCMHGDFILASVYSWQSILPVVPHKAVAEVSKIRKPIGEVGCCESRMADQTHWWTERWLELCVLEWLQWLQWSPHPQLLDVEWCSAVVLVV